MNRDAGRLVRWALSLAILALLVGFARGVDWPATGAALASAAPLPLAAATALNLLSVAAKGVVWWIFLRPIGASSLRLALRATAVGAALSNIAPANAGEAARVLLVSRATRVPAGSVLASVAVERLLQLVAFVPLVAGTLLFLELPAGIARWRTPLAAALAALCVLAAAVLVSARRRQVAQRPAAHLGALRRAGLQFADALTVTTSTPRLLAAGALSLLSWGLQLATYHLAARGCHLSVSLADTATMLVVANLAFLVRLTPGSVGVFQLVYVATAVALGLPHTAAVAASVTLQALQLLPVTLLGVALAPRFVLPGAAPRAPTPSEVA